MGYVYSAMWMLIGLILLFRFAKEKRVFLLLGVYFLYLGIWWLLDTVLTVAMFGGIPGFVFRVTSIVCFGVAMWQFYREWHRNKGKEDEP